MTGAPPDLSGFGGATLLHRLGGGNPATVWRVRWNEHCIRTGMAPGARFTAT